MNLPKTLRSAALIAVLTLALPGQSTFPPGETTLTLDIGNGIRAVAPSRVTVPAGERVRIVGPEAREGFGYAWTRNGRALPGATDRVLTLAAASAADAGSYACLHTSPTSLPLPSQSLVLGVGPVDRLLNLSTRANVGPGTEPAVIAGFVVASPGPAKKIIVRAVGPSLAQFGVTTPLRAPVLRIVDAEGRPYENGYAYPAVVGGLTYEKDLAESLARCGAFAIPAGTRDAVVMMPFQAGLYTAQVASGDGTAGTVLVEVYEVP
jgi:hypothetical protein